MASDWTRLPGRWGSEGGSQQENRTVCFSRRYCAPCSKQNSMSSGAAPHRGVCEGLHVAKIGRQVGKNVLREEKTGYQRTKVYLRGLLVGCTSKT